MLKFVNARTSNALNLKIMRIFTLTLILALVVSSCQFGNEIFSVVSAPPKADTAMLDKAFKSYKEPQLTHRRFKHAEIEQLILHHQQKGVLKVEQIGQSVLQKNIYELTFGQGPKQVMLWSQMHGNEPTATMALFDIFNFLAGNGDGMDSVRQLLQEKTTLHFIPMLNPDGADRYVRRNALDIDLNRDARAGATPEGALLKARAAAINPQYGFNLHDQNIYYNVSGTPTPVTIALLAPAYNREREINDVRGKAMKIAVGMNRLLQQLIPGAVARYDDEYTPRGFGDNFQSWNASTVLIESGGYKGDPEKQFIRELNFKIILNALIEIAEGSYEKHFIHEYDEIPMNDSKLFDVLLRSVKIPFNDSISITADIGVNRDEINQDSTYSVRSRIADLGDLKEYFGYDEVNWSEEYEWVMGKIYPQVLASAHQVSREKALELLKQGYIAAQVAKLPADFDSKNFPIVLFSQRQPYLGYPGTGKEAHFFLSKNGQLHYAVVNGYLYKLID